MIRPFIALIIRLITPFIAPIMVSHMPVTMSPSPFQALFQSPVKTPTIKSIIPPNIPKRPSSMPDMPDMAPSTTSNINSKTELTIGPSTPISQLTIGAINPL